MKNDSRLPHEPQTTARNQPLPARHQFEHEEPTHIHDPEEDMTLLARWLHRALQNPSKFWGTLGTVVIAILGVVVAANLLASGNSRGGDIWTRLDAAKTPAERLDVIKEFPESPATKWETIRVAGDFLYEGFRDLPDNRDVALPNLKKALDLYDQVLASAPKDSAQALVATMGKARTLEARDELEKAIEQYNLVVKGWPDSQEAEQARELVAQLKKPEAVAFYKELHSFRRTKVQLPTEDKLDPSFQKLPPANSIPAGGAATKTGSLDTLLLPPALASPLSKPGTAGTGGAAMPLTTPLLPAPPAASPATSAATSARPASPEMKPEFLPATPFTPAPSPAAKAATTPSPSPVVTPKRAMPAAALKPATTPPAPAPSTKPATPPPAPAPSTKPATPPPAPAPSTKPVTTPPAPAPSTKPATTPPAPAPSRPASPPPSSPAPKPAETKPEMKPATPKAPESKPVAPPVTQKPKALEPELPAQLFGEAPETAPKKP